MRKTMAAIVLLATAGTNMPAARGERHEAPAADMTQAAVVPTAAPATQPARAAVPDDAARRAAMAQVRDVFGQQIDEARTPDERRKLSATLLDTATHTAEPDAKFTLLIEAENLAVLAGDSDAALAARQLTRQSFDLGTWPAAGELYAKLEHIAATPQAQQRLCVATLVEADDALAADQFIVARQLSEMAINSARKSEDRDLSQQAGLMASRISACEAERKRINPALETLAAKPDDPAANFEAGRYECFYKLRWSRGLPMLAKGDNAGLRTLAEAELKGPPDAAGQETLADKWWAMADHQPQVTRSGIRLHAGLWYTRASEGLAGFAKQRAGDRSADYLKWHAELATDTPGGSVIRGYDGVAGMLRALGPLFPGTLANWDVNHQNTANDALHVNIEGKTGTFTITVEQIRRLGSASMTTVNRVAPLGEFTVRVNTAFDPQDKPQWDAIHERGTYTVTGTIQTAKFDGTQLDCLVSNCRLATYGGAKAIAPAAPHPAGPVSPDETADFNSVQQVLAAIPLDLMPKTRQGWMDKADAAKFGLAYGKAFSHKTFKCKVTVARIERVPQTSMIKVSSARFPVGTTQFNFIFFMPDTDPQFALLRIGSAYVLSGRAGGTTWGVDGITINLAHPGVALPR